METVGWILIGLLAVLIVCGNLGFVLWYYFSGRGETTDRSPKHPEGQYQYLNTEELIEELDRACREGSEEDVISTPV